MLDTVLFGREPVEVLQQIAFWVRGKGPTDALKPRESWDVRTVPGR